VRAGFALQLGFPLRLCVNGIDVSGLLSPFKFFFPRERVAVRQTADSDVFATPVTVNSCVVENGGRDGEGLVSLARGLGESHRPYGDSHLAALPSKSLRWSALICSLIFRRHRRLAAAKRHLRVKNRLAELVQHGFPKWLVLHQGLNLQ
jgi:hypothetical protein